MKNDCTYDCKHLQKLKKQELGLKLELEFNKKAFQQEKNSQRYKIKEESLDEKQLPKGIKSSQKYL